MHDAIMVELATTGNAVTVFGWSQSAIIASLEMQRFTAMGGAAPSASDLNFVLVGNEMNPNGGMLARFPDLTLPTLDLTFYGATPSDTIYPTAIYTLEYDGFADFSRYPLNFISDLNAVAGITFVHTKYLDLTPAQVEGATKLPTSPGYTGVTDYYIIRTENRPLLQPLRAVPVIGDPLADLIQTWATATRTTATRRATPMCERRSGCGRTCRLRSSPMPWPPEHKKASLTSRPTCRRCPRNRSRSRRSSCRNPPIWWPRWPPHRRRPRW